MTTGNPPLAGFHFSVSFSGLEPADIDSRFSEVFGLSAEMETLKLKEGGENRFTHELPVKTSFPHLVLKRAVFPVDSKVIEWAEEALFNFSFRPLEVQVKLLNDQHSPVKGWNFKGVFPVKIEYSALNAQDNKLLIETLELAYQFARPLNT